jgi:hypothetical protein
MNTETPQFTAFPKMARLSRECIITEKIDGTNASVFIRELPDNEVMPTGSPVVACVGNLLIYAGSRTRWITPEDDNFGFAAWVRDNADELRKLGVGRHFGEWWGSGIQRKYGLDHRRFSLFNTLRWHEHDRASVKVSDAVVDKKGRVLAEEKWTEVAPACCHVVPVLYKGRFSTEAADRILEGLRIYGSAAATGFLNPEGIVVFHVAGNVGFKKTFDDTPKGEQ